MCGLYGVHSRRMGAVHTKIFKHLAFLSLKRGLDAAGMVVVKRQKYKGKQRLYVEWARRAANAAIFYNSSDAKDLMASSNKVVMMGHNRDATSGELSVEAAHPHEHKDIIGLHNGTIFDAAYNPSGQFVSDSDRFIHGIAHRGLVPTTQAMSNGHFALTYLDSSDSCIYMVRNFRRPLFLMWTKDKNTLTWASEITFLEEVADRGQFKWDEPSMLPASTLFSLNLLTNETKEVKVDLEKPLRTGSGTPLGRSFRAGARNGGVAGSYEHLGNINKNLTKRQRKQMRATAVERTKGIRDRADKAITRSRSGHPSITFYYAEEIKEDYVEYFHNIHIPLEQYNNMLSRGCGWCTASADTHDNVVWVNTGDYICPDCLTEPMVHHFLYGEDKPVG